MLLSNMRSIHNVFHVFLLKSYRGERDYEESSSIELNEENQEEIEKILNSKMHYDKLKYLVKWLEYSNTDNQWLSAIELQNANEIVRDFHNKYSTKSKSIKRRRV